MSLILDALNRSRGDQADARAPTLDSVHFEASHPNRSWRMVLIATLSVALLMALLLAMLLPRELLIWGQSASVEDQDHSANIRTLEIPITVESPITAERPMSAQPSQSVSPESAAAGVSPAATSAPSPAAEPAIAALYDGVEAEQREPSPVQSGDGFRDANVPQESVDTTASAAQNAVAAGVHNGVDGVAVSDTDNAMQRVVDEAREIPVDVEAVLREAQQAMGTTALSAHSVALLESLSQRVKDQIPTVVYSRHDYVNNGQSFVTLNNTRLTVGQRDRGFLVKEILIDSVILSWGGYDFRLRALNSWINL